jgi:peptidoglycan/xylan/chitin deacetylase (PgdA/CDA1 family)
MIKNFLFHKINPERNDLWDPIAIDLFDKYICFISKNYKIELLENLVSTDNFDTKERYATIQFDDGYKDNIEYALPILHKYKCKASFYVITDSIDNNIPPWTYLLKNFFLETTINRIDLPFEFLPNFLKSPNFQTREQKKTYALQLQSFLKTISSKERNLVITAIYDKLKDISPPMIMMNWRDLNELKNDGHYIGSHTMTHGEISTLADETEIKIELQDSGKLIEKNLGYFPKTIAYPFGTYNKKIIDLSKDIGYSIGLTVRQIPYNPSVHSVFEIPRIELFNEPWWKARLRMASIFQNVKTIIRK